MASMNRDSTSSSLGRENSVEIFPRDLEKKKQKRKMIKYAVVVLCVALLCGAMTGAAVYWSRKRDPKVRTIPNRREMERVDCLPDEQRNRELCLNRSCIWSPSDIEKVPACFFPPANEWGYDRLSFNKPNQNTDRYILQDKLDSFGHVSRLILDVIYLTNDIFQVKIYPFDSTNKRYEVPLEYEELQSGIMPSNPRYNVTLSGEDSTFEMKVTRLDTLKVIWDTSISNLIFSEQLLQIATRLPSKNVYGFGENLHMSLKHDLNFKTWPMFTRDQAPSIDKEYNLYSVHPFYECMEDSIGNTHGVFLKNSNAMDYTLTPLPMLVYRAIGGIFDFYFFMGPTPENVIQQYTSLIGRPFMPPYWSLGFHLSRYGFRNTSDMRAAVERTTANNIPLDVIHADIDYMDRQRDFTIDNKNFKNLPNYLEGLWNKSKIRTIIILDPALEIANNYRPYELGRKEDIFVKWPNRNIMPDNDFNETNSLDMMGYVWPEWKVLFPDFFLNKTKDVWSELLVDFVKDMKRFDGLWLDMNEPANFGTNEEKPFNWPPSRNFTWSLKCPVNKYDDPPFRPKSAYGYDSVAKRERLSAKTLCLIASLDQGRYRMYDVHSLYGHKQAEISLEPLRKAVGRGKRSIIISRSTYAGSGKFAGRWLGDNSATWQDMRLSIIGMLESNLFGIPFIGADICGFFGAPTKELCGRWMQLGAFYPFARNHNDKKAPNQDPGSLGSDVIKLSREALETRYSLLPYLYTLFHQAHTLGSTVARPLFHEFYHDNVTHAIDRQFLWGKHLLISPFLDEGASENVIYLPKGQSWFDFYTGKRISGGTLLSVKQEKFSRIPLHVRAGSIIPMRRPQKTTQESLHQPFRLLVSPNSRDEASGVLFHDNGESIDSFENQRYLFVEFTYTRRRLTVQRIDANLFLYPYIFEITVHRVAQNPSFVSINGETHHTYSFHPRYNLLHITNLSLDITSSLLVEWGNY
ncbi:DgyrCDS4198 [Dimorphilus gyrociliatus]|uniref:DgyrCDS4198 n=1 Tax=Dimorphilus gyrociliatus TaxID=2664684 RepID=A0A7I8VID8_9ANNE|nr:DgyrCDS4198 [Dimorphilus gyrociliatus]